MGVGGGKGEGEGEGGREVEPGVGDGGYASADTIVIVCVCRSGYAKPVCLEFFFFLWLFDIVYLHLSVCVFYWYCSICLFPPSTLYTRGFPAPPPCM